MERKLTREGVNRALRYSKLQKLAKMTKSLTLKQIGKNLQCPYSLVLSLVASWHLMHLGFFCIENASRDFHVVVSVQEKKNV